MISSAAGPIGGINAVTADGASVLYWQLPGTHSAGAASTVSVMRKPTASGPPQVVLQLPSDGSDYYFFCPLKPGLPCVLNLWEGDELVFYELDPLHGKGARLGDIRLKGRRQGFRFWHLSPDASEIAVVEDGWKDRIRILTLATGQSKDTVVDLGWGSFQFLSWAPDGTGFFVTTVKPESYNLILVSRAGKVTPLLTNDLSQILSVPLPSPDGKHLMFGAGTWDSNVWTLEKAK